MYMQRQICVAAHGMLKDSLYTSTSEKCTSIALASGVSRDLPHAISELDKNAKQWECVERSTGVAPGKPISSHLLAQEFLSYDIYYKAGAQVGSSDCRVQVLRFARIFGLTNLIALRTNPSAFGWKLLAH